MHHAASRTATSKDSDACACRSTSDPATVIVASLIGPAGVLTPATAAISPAMITADLAAFAPAPLDRSFVPDSPPPRA